MNWKWFFGGLISFEILADVFAKQYSITGMIVMFVLSIACYVFANASWLIALRANSELARMANMFSVSSGLLAVLVGVGIYGEKLLMVHYVGVVLGVISLILLCL